ncbi:peptide deformylase [Candidatus Schneideria nysicola]|nr:peptide deformylase [Candidatus Schneideria nysicola]UAJ66212.1 peptide deformylase [Candidatus Schneideria nysicola]
MSRLNLLYYPDNRLRQIAHRVEHINEEIKSIINDMFETMYAEKGIGLASTQVNIHKQIIVIDISENKNQRLVLINPKILKKSGKICIQEGCLSIPQYRGFVSRSRIIRVQALDQNGKNILFNAKNLLAVCIQHEMDHLIGKLFIDSLSETYN